MIRRKNFGFIYTEKEERITLAGKTKNHQA
jgi:hypothetical protein